MGQAMYNLTSSDGLVAQAGLGDEITVNGNTYRYIRASGAIAAYQLCHVTAAGSAIESTTALVGTPARPTALVIPQFALATLEYGWAPVGPFGPYREDGFTTFKVNAALNCATSVKLYTTATAGVVDDSATTGIIAGLALTESITTAEAADCVAASRLTAFCP